MGTEKRDLSDREKNRLYAISAVTVAARSNVPRDWRTLEVNDVSHREAPTRLSAALGQLYLGLECIGLLEEESWSLVRRVALDSVPMSRGKVLMMLKGKEKYYCDPKHGGLSVKDLRDELKCSTRTTAIVIEDLIIHGLVEKVEMHTRPGRQTPEEQVASGVVRLTDWARKQCVLGWGKEEKET
jgi:hypothetical protein